MAGNLADWLQKARGWKAVRVRALTQSLATLGGSPLRVVIMHFLGARASISMHTLHCVKGHGRGSRIPEMGDVRVQVRR